MGLNPHNQAPAPSKRLIESCFEILHAALYPPSLIRDLGAAALTRLNASSHREWSIVGNYSHDWPAEDVALDPTMFAACCLSLEGGWSTDHPSQAAPLSCRLSSQALPCLSRDWRSILSRKISPIFAFSQNSSCHSRIVGYLVGRSSGQSSPDRSCWLDRHFAHWG